MTRDSLEKLLSEIRALNSLRYQHLDLTGLTAFVIKWLLDRDIPTTFENVVVVAFKLFPDKFAMVGYAEYPDATRVNRSLLQLGPKYRNWARGSVQKGFVLTESGKTKVADIELSLSSNDESGPPRVMTKQRPRTADTEGELMRVANSVLFRKWANGQLDLGTELDLLDMLGAYAYTPHRALRKRISELHTSAVHFEKDNIVEFLEQVRRVYSTTLADD